MFQMEANSLLFFLTLFLLFCKHSTSSLPKESLSHRKGLRMMVCACTLSVPGVRGRAGLDNGESAANEHSETSPRKQDSSIKKVICNSVTYLV